MYLALKSWIGEGVPQIQLDDTQDKKWHTLCGAMRDKLPGCNELARGRQWPRKIGHGHDRKRLLELQQAAAKDKGER